MALPRRKYVQEGKVGVYHCTTRCVRRAYLHGFDAQTGRDFSHRKVWISDRLRFLSSILAVEVSSFSVMDNHYHTTVRIRPDIAQGWSDREVASRWLRLCPGRLLSKKGAKEPDQQKIGNLALNRQRIAELRKRLCSLSWFMKHINEFIARRANKEDDVKGRFWESRFKCQALLDHAAVAACMVYVDLNPVRAGRATVPEGSDFTSIQQRIRLWQEQTRDGWLCPISAEGSCGGILPMTDEEYFDLVDRSGRMLRSDKRGSIDEAMEPILLRIGAKPEAWSRTIANFGERFCLVAGWVGSLRDYAEQIGKRWFTGLSEARNAFVSSPLK